MTRRGDLRIHLGAAPGVGKTFAMLCEARRRQERGADVVVGIVETHGRAKTGELLDGLEIIPRREIGGHPGLDKMDLDAVLARRPELVLVDELAHTNAPGSRHAKRWQDVEELLEHGIDVLTTVNVQHLESLNDVVERITGVRQQETVPDDVVRRAEQLELVDITPEALRRRLAHGNVYTAERIDAALANYFQPSNLTALRELALLWVADEVDVALQRYRHDKQITEVWETRERVVVALTGDKESETVLRRAARIAKRSGAADLLAVHILRGDGLAGSPVGAVARLRRLAEDVGASFHTVVGGEDVPAALLDFARWPRRACPWPCPWAIVWWPFTCSWGRRPRIGPRSPNCSVGGMSGGPMSRWCCCWASMKAVGPAGCSAPPSPNICVTSQRRAPNVCCCSLVRSRRTTGGSRCCSIGGARWWPATQAGTPPRWCAGCDSACCLGHRTSPRGMRGALGGSSSSVSEHRHRPVGYTGASEAEEHEAVLRPSTVRSTRWTFAPS